MKHIKRFQAGVARVTLAMSAVGMSTIAISILAAVLCRYVFKISAMWVEQYTRYMLIWIVFLSGNVLVYRNELMRVDFFDNLWPTKFLKVREALYTVLFVIILLVLTWQGWIQAKSFWGVAVIGLPVDKFWVYFSVPVGAALMLIQYLLNLVCIFLKKRGEKQK
jgi:TRAP-type C4-dicarboxylate transport system permease small subunit